MQWQNSGAEMDQKKIVTTLKKWQAFADEVLPQAGPLVLDIGNLNDALLETNDILHELSNEGID